MITFFMVILIIILMFYFCIYTITIHCDTNYFKMFIKLGVS